VLVGEIRDAETAELALRASLTGHLVLSTLHTNDSVSAVTRLVDMGAEPFLVASSLALVLAQRLVRRPCPSCAAPSEPDPETLSALGLDPAELHGADFRQGPGCADCGRTGYRGRVGVFELLRVTPDVRAALLTSPTEASLAAAARGRTTLRTAALTLAGSGGTTLNEVLRTTERSGWAD
jgi:type IV pilus assembly protein PilB